MTSQIIKSTIPFVSLVGNSNSGKTTLIEQIVRELKKLGYRVATVKHAHHGFNIDRPGKDSYRLKEAGSDVVVVSSPTQLALIKDIETEASLSQIATLIGNKVDIILLEGFKSTTKPKIVIFNDKRDTNLLSQKENILTAIIARPSSQGKPQFADEEVSNIINLLVDRIRDASAQIYQRDYKSVELELTSGPSVITSRGSG